MYNNERWVYERENTLFLKIMNFGYVQSNLLSLQSVFLLQTCEYFFLSKQHLISKQSVLLKQKRINFLKKKVCFFVSQLTSDLILLVHIRFL